MAEGINGSEMQLFSPENTRLVEPGVPPARVSPACARVGRIVDEKFAAPWSIVF
jgi:hypothetical protein